MPDERESTTSERGWAWPSNAQKAHFFVAGRSLCGKWAWLGSVAQDSPRYGYNDCAECARRAPAARVPAEEDGR